MKKILLFGSQGLLGQELTFLLSDNFEIVPLSHFHVGIEDFEGVEEIITEMKPDIIINAVGAHSLPEQGRRFSEDKIHNANTVGAVNIALICSEQNIQFIHFSCASAIHPQDIIGETKEAAEKQIIHISKESGWKNFEIIRLGIICGGDEDVFIKSLQKMLKEKNIIIYDNGQKSLSSVENIHKHIESALLSPGTGNIESICFSGTMNLEEMFQVLSEEGREYKKENAIDVPFVLESTIDSGSLEDYFKMRD
ncbi:hypothetical protein COB57_03515 [Candidatus Peregrinibacteria bacterium]|nr:MAG: hypothetical protein COB57_03515 [Candidatus Peregrinibacteria bacterium]